MKKRSAFFTVLVVLASIIIMVYRAAAQDTTATQEAEDAALIERGAYLAEIGACIDCHTPYKEDYADFSALTPEQLQTLALYTLDAQDVENKMLSGGRPFDLGPAGVLMSRNLTPDEETGIGLWTDQE